MTKIPLDDLREDPKNPRGFDFLSFLISRGFQLGVNRTGITRTYLRRGNQVVTFSVDGKRFSAGVFPLRPLLFQKAPLPKDELNGNLVLNTLGQLDKANQIQEMYLESQTPSDVREAFADWGPVQKVPCDLFAGHRPVSQPPLTILSYRPRGLTPADVGIDEDAEYAAIKKERIADSSDVYPLGNGMFALTRRGLAKLMSEGFADAE